VAKYLVVLTGLVQAAVLLGFAWARVQWLVAGLTVGLGFGLQEVFANLVSGLIILMERPVRVGDYVSVNNVTGTVTKMALRATTIQDADRREWIVPNKKFITDDVMNWTLSDTVSRAVFPIGVMHGSDTVLVQEILLAQAQANAQILDYPEPSVVMARIGGASLDFELRVFLPSRGVYTQVQNDLLVKIERALREAGIELELPMFEGQEKRRRSVGRTRSGKRRMKKLPSRPQIAELETETISEKVQLVVAESRPPTEPTKTAIQEVTEFTEPRESVPFKRPEVVFSNRKAA
jgi:potassium efflux system protein